MNKYLLIISLFLFSISGIGQNPENAIHIPADKRHIGLSKFDNLPFTDRRKGDPDRYRAINPNFVKKFNGKYYFLLTAKDKTSFYDENLKVLGVLPEKNVEVDLTERKTATNADGKSQRYVYVRDKGFILFNSLEETMEEIKTGKWYQFPLKKGDNYIFDGAGIKRGELTAKSVRLNYGQQKDIDGERYYYAFSTKMKSVGDVIGVSGWIKASIIAAGNDPQYSSEVVTKMQPEPTVNDKFTVYEITGGMPEEKISKNTNGKIMYKFGYQGADGKFIAFKVLPKVPLEGRQSIASTDYLKRSDDVVNLGFNVAGVSNDTFKVDNNGKPLQFFRSSVKDATVYIDLFHPKDARHTGEETVGKMIFVYGYVDVQGQKRWGWIPLDALRIVNKGI